MRKDCIDWLEFLELERALQAFDVTISYAEDGAFSISVDPRFEHLVPTAKRVFAVVQEESKEPDPWAVACGLLHMLIEDHRKYHKGEPLATVLEHPDNQALALACEISKGIAKMSGLPANRIGLSGRVQ